MLTCPVAFASSSPSVALISAMAMRPKRAEARAAPQSAIGRSVTAPRSRAEAAARS